MLTYFLGGYNDYQIRTKQIPSGSNFLSLCTQNMITQEEYCVLFNTGQYSYNECESFVSFSVDLDIPLSVNIADEYRLTLTPAITSATVPFTYLDPIWNGSLQVFASQSVNKPAYVNQIPYEETFISADTNNTFKYWEQASPSPSTTTTTAGPTTTTTTAAPTTTTTSTTSTTTTSTTSTTSTTTTSTTTTTTTTAAPTTTTTSTTSTTTAGPTTTTTTLATRIIQANSCALGSSDVLTFTDATNNMRPFVTTGLSVFFTGSAHGCYSYANVGGVGPTGFTLTDENFVQYAYTGGCADCQAVYPEATQSILYFGNQVGGMGFDQCIKLESSNPLISGSIQVLLTSYYQELVTSSDCATGSGLFWGNNATQSFNGNIIQQIPAISAGAIDTTNWYRRNQYGTLQIRPTSPLGYSSPYNFNLLSGSNEVSYSVSGYTYKLIISASNGLCSLNDEGQDCYVPY